MIKSQREPDGMTDVAVRSYSTRIGIPSDSRSLSAAPSRNETGDRCCTDRLDDSERVHIALGKRPQSGANDRLNYPSLLSQSSARVRIFS
jgi:hypothetical protein